MDTCQKYCVNGCGIILGAAAARVGSPALAGEGSEYVVGIATVAMGIAAAALSLNNLLGKKPVVYMIVMGESMAKFGNHLNKRFEIAEKLFAFTYGCVKPCVRSLSNHFRKYGNALVLTAASKADPDFVFRNVKHLWMLWPLYKNYRVDERSVSSAEEAARAIEEAKQRGSLDALMICSHSNAEGMLLDGDVTHPIFLRGDEPVLQAALRAASPTVTILAGCSTAARTADGSPNVAERIATHVPGVVFAPTTDSSEPDLSYHPASKYPLSARFTTVDNSTNVTARLQSFHWPHQRQNQPQARNSHN